MKTIPLTQGKVAIVDDCDYDWLLSFGKWYFDNSGVGYAARNKPKPQCGILRMHKIIAERMGFPVDVEIDHRDTDSLNNCRSNLRIATRRQQCYNRRVQSNSKSGYKGVFWDKCKEKWLCQITVDGQTKFLGYFTDPRKGAKAYNEAARKYHGDFAALNEV